ncbi:hypothetical protein [Burkholderia ubonensis]|uniref:DUF7303 family protein n=1 Tax=Burkholderia ubonensis TaxID=101571 RepID=UPI000AE16896|nr:hypothetical protein [Burkholderia ubonensis]
MRISKTTLQTQASRPATEAAPGFVIEKGLPIPRAARGRRPRYPFAKLEIGDSFFVAGKGAALLKELSNCANYHRRHHGGNFVVRSVDGGVRAWRVAPKDATGSSEPA